MKTFALSYILNFVLQLFPQKRLKNLSCLWDTKIICLLVTVAIAEKIFNFDKFNVIQGLKTSSVDLFVINQTYIKS